MDVAADVLWPVVVLAVCAAGLWRLDRWVSRLASSSEHASRLAAEVAAEEKRVALLERETAAKIAAATADAQIAYTNASLRRQRAEQETDEQLARELQAVRFEADKAVIEARAAAECALAPDLVREEATERLESARMRADTDTSVDLVGEYKRLLDALAEHDKADDAPSFEDFADSFD